MTYLQALCRYKLFRCIQKMLGAGKEKLPKGLAPLIDGIGNNLSQIARHLNREVAVGNIRPIDGVALAAQFVVIERLLLDKIDEASK